MKIVKKVVDANTASPKTRAFIDMSNVSTDKFDVPEEQLTFHVNTYAKLDYKYGDNDWIDIFKPINIFLGTLTEDEQVILGEMFVKVHHVLTHEFTRVDQISHITQKLSEIAYAAIKATDLSKKIYTFVKNSDIPIPDLGYVGKKPHHSKDMSFGYDDYIGLTSIVLLCKLFCPVFGEIIYLTKKTLDNSLKETHCIAVLKLILGNDFFDLSQKFQNYISNTIMVRKQISATSTFNGYTYSKFSLIIYAAMLVKKFVNVNIYRQGGNLVVYAITCVRSTMSSLESNMKKKNSVRERKDPGESGDEEGNYSRLETESFPSRSPVDVPVLVQVGVEHFIRTSMDEYNIDLRQFEEAVRYYEKYPSPITDINKYIICTFFGHHIGGAFGINMLDADTFMKLIAFTQLYMLNYMHDVADYDLIHAISIIPTDKIKVKSTLVDDKIQMSKGASFAYRNCKQMFPYSIGNTSWDAKTKDITDFITTQIHMFNTANVIWDRMGQPNENNKTFVYGEGILQAIFKFIEHVLQIVGQTVKEEAI